LLEIIFVEEVVHVHVRAIHIVQVSRTSIGRETGYQLVRRFNIVVFCKVYVMAVLTGEHIMGLFLARWMTPRTQLRVSERQTQADANDQ
jgi:hypothetical protein